MLRLSLTFPHLLTNIFIFSRQKFSDLAWKNLSSLILGLIPLLMYGKGGTPSERGLDNMVSAKEPYTKCLLCAVGHSFCRFRFT